MMTYKTEPAESLLRNSAGSYIITSPHHHIITTCPSTDGSIFF